VSGEAYVGKITMENVNNKNWFYEPAVSVGPTLTAENFYGFGVNGGTLLSSSYKRTIS
jgi:hypothetical protein